jgi:hypothetical protein
MNKEIMEVLASLAAGLHGDIIEAYVTSPTIEEAEKLAAEFLSGQIHAANALRITDLDARMRKAGVKSVRAAVYLEECNKKDKKPTEATLIALIDSNALVCSEQVAFDTAEVDRDLLQNYFNVFKEAHIYFRGLSRGRFE